MASCRETCFPDSVCVFASGDNFPLPSLAFYIYDNHLQEELFMWHLAKCFKNTIAIRLFLTTLLCRRSCLHIKLQRIWRHNASCLGPIRNHKQESWLPPQGCPRAWGLSLFMLEASSAGDSSNSNGRFVGIRKIRKAGQLVFGQGMELRAELQELWSSTLAWKIPRMEEPGRLQSMGSLRVGHD